MQSCMACRGQPRKNPGAPKYSHGLGMVKFGLGTDSKVLQHTFILHMRILQRPEIIKET